MRSLQAWLFGLVQAEGHLQKMAASLDFIKQHRLCVLPFVEAATVQTSYGFAVVVLAAGTMEIFQGGWRPMQQAINLLVAPNFEIDRKPLGKFHGQLRTDPSAATPI